MSLPIRTIDTATLLNAKAISNSNAETSILVSPSITVPDGAVQIVIMVSAVGVASQTPIGIGFHLRRGSGLTGVVVGNDKYGINVQSGSPEMVFGMNWIDQISAIGTVQYTLSATYSGNDGSGQCTYAGMIVLVV